MDSPVKFQIPNLSSADLVRLVMPIAPGLIIAVDVALAGIRPLQVLASAGVGYKTAVSAISIATYISGLAVIQILDLISALIFQKVNERKNTPISTDPYWRLVAGLYVGKKLSPDSIQVDISSEQIDYLLIAGVLDESSAADLRERCKRDEERQNARNQIQEYLQNYAWRQLAFACSEFDKDDDPYAGYDAVVIGIQAAASCGLILVLYVAGIWDKSLIAIFALGVFSACFYTRIYIDRLDNVRRDLNAGEIGALIKKMKSDEHRPEQCGHKD